MFTFKAYSGTALGHGNTIVRDSVAKFDGLGINSGMLVPYQVFCLQHPIVALDKNLVLDITLIKQYIGTIHPLFANIKVANGKIYNTNKADVVLQTIDNGHTLKLVGTVPNSEDAKIAAGTLYAYYAISPQETV